MPMPKVKPKKQLSVHYAHAPEFPYMKQERWIVMLWSEKSKQMYEVKRIPCLYDVEVLCVCLLCIAKKKKKQLPACKKKSQSLAHNNGKLGEELTNNVGVSKYIW